MIAKTTFYKDRNFTGRLTMKKLTKIIKMYVFAVLVGCLLCGCVHREDSSAVKLESEENESKSMTEQGTSNQEVPHKTKTIPQNKEEKEKLFGRVTNSGVWIPPKDSYTDPKTGDVYNREGTLIGSRNNGVIDDSDAVG